MAVYIQTNQIIELEDDDNDISIVDTGKEILIPALSQDIVINLPPVGQNLFYRFMVEPAATLGFAAVITPAAVGLCNGTLINTVAAAGVSEPVDGEDTVTFNATSIAGDYMDVISDGTNWYVSGISSVAGFTVP